MTLEELITDLHTIYALNSKVMSVGYGPRESYSTNKEGVLYPRAYLYLVEADQRTVTLELTVTDDVLPDLSNRLNVQSRMLTLAKELVQQMIANTYLQYDVDVTYDPTRLHQEDQTEGYTVEFNIVLDEQVDVCDIINNNN